MTNAAKTGSDNPAKSTHSLAPHTPTTAEGAPPLAEIMRDRVRPSLADQNRG